MGGRFPTFGDIYQEVRDDELFSQTMVVAIDEGAITLGGGRVVFWADLNDENKWQFIRNITD